MVNQTFFISGGITNTEDKVLWPHLDNYKAPHKEPILAPTTNTIPNTNGIISILPAPPQVVSKYEHKERYPRNYFLPSIPDSNNPATQIIPPVTTVTSQSVASNTEAFIPVTPNWLKIPTKRPVSRTKTITRTSLNAGNNVTKNKFWEQIPNPRPVLSHIQKPLRQRRPKNIVVKHGLFPLIKSRRRYPTRFF